jgi:hypothetical protein
VAIKNAQSRDTENIGQHKIQSRKHNPEKLRTLVNTRYKPETLRTLVNTRYKPETLRTLVNTIYKAKTNKTNTKFQHRKLNRRATRTPQNISVEHTILDYLLLAK